jgi:hypothetical protein
MLTSRSCVCTTLESPHNPFAQTLCAAKPCLPNALLQVVESLLDPATVDRLKAVRSYVEQPDGAFPPPPVASGAEAYSTCYLAC